MFFAKFSLSMIDQVQQKGKNRVEMKFGRAIEDFTANSPLRTVMYPKRTLLRGV